MRLTAYFLFALLFSSRLIAQNDRLTPDNLWQLERVGSVHVSPDGKTILYTQTKYNLSDNKGVTSLYSMPASGGTPTMISDGKTSMHEVQWRPDGKRIGFISHQSGSAQLWEMNPDGTDQKQVTNYPFDVSNYLYSPDMKHVSFSFDVKMELSMHDRYADLPKASGKAYDDLMFRHWTQWHDYTYQHIAIANYENGVALDDFIDIMREDRADAPMMPFGGTEQIAWSSDGKHLVYSCKKLVGKEYALSTNSELYQCNVEDGNTMVLTPGRMGYDNDPVYSPDGKWLAWLSMEHDGFESDKTAIWILNTKTGEQMPVTAAVDQSFGSIVWGADMKSLYALSMVNATSQIYRIDLQTDGAERVKFKALTAVTSGTHDINGISRAGNALIGTKTTMSKPAEVYSWDMKTGAETQLSHINDKLLSSLKMGKVEKRMVKTTDGLDMLVWVIYPPDFDPSKKYPTLLYCQGGPQSAVSQFFSYRWNFQLMAANGYIVVAPNRRGLPGFGQQWNDAISKDWGGQAIKDYLSAIDDVSKESYVNKEKLGAVGASYGGYSVYYLAGVHENRFSCFVSHCGLFNLESWYGSTEELFFANWDIGGPYWDPKLSSAYLKNSPHRMVDKWNTPIMVIHNDLDFRVPINQGLEAFNAAQQKNIPSRLLFYPDEGHWVLKPQNGVMWHREYFRWLDQWLKN